MIKKINNQNLKTTELSSEKSFCERLTEELEERYEMETCRDHYCAHWYTD